MLRGLAVPRADFLSHTYSGAPWVDFEWLTQLIYHGIFQAAGFPGLFLFKLLIFCFGAWVLTRILALQGIGKGGRGLGALLWVALMLPKTDLRPDGFSLIFFSLELWFLEAYRIKKTKPGGREYVLAVAFFALWANLHLGFLYGLVLLGLYWVGGGRKRYLAALSLAAWFGTLLNPYGYLLYGVVLEHLRFLEPLSEVILEWKPVSLTHPWAWPFAALWALSLVLVVIGFIKRRTPWVRAHLVSVLLFGAGALVHSRHAAYFSLVALPAAFVTLKSLAQEAKLRLKDRRLAFGLLYAALALFWVFQVRPQVWPLRTLDDSRFPVQAAGFLEEESPMLAGLKLYNPWGWGGYLGYEVGSEYKVFQDGRYIFHPLLAEGFSAVKDPKAWRVFMDRYGIDLALLENRPLMLPSEFLVRGAPPCFRRKTLLYFLYAKRPLGFSLVE